MMLDLSRVTFDPHFSAAFIVLRHQGEWLNGRWISETLELSGVGVIKPLTTAELETLPEGDRIHGGIKIYTTTRLYLTSESQGITSDEIKYKSIFYKVTSVQDYSPYGHYQITAIRRPGA